MDRREFLKAFGGAALAGLAPACLAQLLPSSAVTAFALDGKANTTNKVVVLFLRGAIDGLSVVVPYGDPRYYQVRPKIAVAKPGEQLGAIKLDGTFGLHPSLAPLMPLWQNKTLSFHLNTGSPDPTRSHFDAQDYMESGVPGTKVVGTGWMNRLLSQLPDNGSPVRALNVGTTTPRILQGPIASATYAPSPKRKPSMVESPYIARAFEKMYDTRKDDLGKAFEQGMEARATITERLSDQGTPEQMQQMTAADQGAIQATKFTGFGRQLGKLIREEPKVQVAFVDLGGFDTHVNQGNGKGQLANHLNVLGTGLSELATALGPTYQNTLVLVMSEFGRTVKENGNAGTDHGHGNFIWMMGGPVAGGKLHGNWDGIGQNSLYEGRDLPVLTDFRSVVGPMVAEHMGLSKAQLANIFPDYKLNYSTGTSLLKS